MRIPYGTALVALEASSDMWTQESKAPIVQIGLSQLRNQAHPGVHVVKFPVVPNMYLASFRWLARPIGSAITVAAMSTKLALGVILACVFNANLLPYTTKTVCKFAIAFEMVDASTPCTSTQHMKTTYTMPFEASHSPSRAMTMTETNMSAKP
jgi:hypothetical protein